MSCRPCSGCGAKQRRRASSAPASTCGCSRMTASSSSSRRIRASSMSRTTTPSSSTAPGGGPPIRRWSGRRGRDTPCIGRASGGAWASAFPRASSTAGCVGSTGAWSSCARAPTMRVRSRPAHGGTIRRTAAASCTATPKRNGVSRPWSRASSDPQCARNRSAGNGARRRGRSRAGSRARNGAGRNGTSGAGSRARNGAGHCGRSSAGSRATIATAA